MQLDSTLLISAWLLAKSNSHLQKCTITYVLIIKCVFKNVCDKSHMVEGICTAFSPYDNGSY